MNDKKIEEAARAKGLLPTLKTWYCTLREYTLSHDLADSPASGIDHSALQEELVTAQQMLNVFRDDGGEGDIRYHLLHRDREAPMEIWGTKTATVSTRHRRPRWTELHLYKAVGPVWDTGPVDLYVVHEIARTTCEDEQDRRKVYTGYTVEELKREVGSGPLAKQLYREAGLDGLASLPRKTGADER